MKYFQPLLLAGLLLPALSAQAGNTSFESGSRPNKHLVTQSHSLHGWQAKQSEPGRAASVFGAFSSQYEASQESSGLAAVSAVPEPETFAMMLAGIGLIGTIVRRRRFRPEA